MGCIHREFSYESPGEKLLKIGRHLPKLSSNIKGLSFLGTRCRYDADVNIHLQQLQSNVTRRHISKLANTRYHYDLLKYSFTIRVVNIWNILPESVISEVSVGLDGFKNRLDNVWSNQDILTRFLIR